MKKQKKRGAFFLFFLPQVHQPPDGCLLPAGACGYHHPLRPRAPCWRLLQEEHLHRRSQGHQGPQAAHQPGGGGPDERAAVHHKAPQRRGHAQVRQGPAGVSRVSRVSEW